MVAIGLPADGGAVSPPYVRDEPATRSAATWRKQMHPLVAYDLAKLRIAEAHQLAERERRFRIADDLDDATARVRFPGRTSLPGIPVRPVLSGRITDGLSR